GTDGQHRKEFVVTGEDGVQQRVVTDHTEHVPRGTTDRVRGIPGVLFEEDGHVVQEGVRLAHQNGLQQSFLAAEDVVERLPGHTCGRGDVHHPPLHPPTGDDLRVGGVHQPFPGRYVAGPPLSVHGVHAPHPAIHGSGATSVDEEVVVDPCSCEVTNAPSTLV